MSSDTMQLTLLRIAAFLVDALTLTLALMLPAALTSYGFIWFAGDRSIKTIQLIWYGPLFILLIGLLVRDGYRGRSPGKRLLGLALHTRRGKDCGYGRSVVRNVPLMLFPFTLLEVYFVLRGRDRLGDRIAGTSVTEE